MTKCLKTSDQNEGVKMIQIYVTSFIDNPIL